MAATRPVARGNAREPAGGTPGRSGSRSRSFKESTVDALLIGQIAAEFQKPLPQVVFTSSEGFRGPMIRQEQQTAEAIRTQLRPKLPRCGFLH
jgi:hypothetical protein